MLKVRGLIVIKPQPLYLLCRSQVYLSTLKLCRAQISIGHPQLGCGEDNRQKAAKRGWLILRPLVDTYVIDEAARTS